ncbi:MAG: dTDP-4-dehydrorhamnose 3,5-epimerase [Desulfovibrio sp.]|jgi:dTDP-4-dehydrorhamnose 3,5-epimerase|nr:dTDP-4-dehydrorhamnose 3,5-epimerase [Desulfovibrio sp.]
MMRIREKEFETGNMEFSILAPAGPVLLSPKVHGDERGFFMETFRQNEFEACCGPYVFVQDNHSKSRHGVLRGMHYQLSRPQGKLVRVIQGRVYDAAVDLRLSSPTFGKSFCVVLDDENRRIFWIPPGFAHGFLVLSGEAEFVYKCTNYYVPEDEYCLRYDDPAAAIGWPLPEAELRISTKDRQGLSFDNCPKFA